jgi:hypothetical protein
MWLNCHTTSIFPKVSRTKVCNAFWHTFNRFLSPIKNDFVNLFSHDNFTLRFKLKLKVEISLAIKYNSLALPIFYHHYHLEELFIYLPVVCLLSSQWQLLKVQISSGLWAGNNTNSLKPGIVLGHWEHQRTRFISSYISMSNCLYHFVGTDKCKTCRTSYLF